MRSSEWKEVSLGGLLNFKRGHDLPKTKMSNGKIPVVGSNGIIGFHNEFTTGAPCLTIGRSGNIGNPYYLDIDSWAHNTTLYVDNYKGNNPKYLYYLLKTLNLRYYGGGSAVPTLNRNHIHPIQVTATLDKYEQKVIADTLSCLDDKIELNNKINKNLEEMAQAIFKSWFIDFEPFQDGEFEDSELGMIPKGWRVGTLGDYVKIKSGYAFKSAWWEKQGVPVIKIKEINNETINFSDISYVSLEKAKLAKDFKVNGGDLVIAMTGATIGKFALVPIMRSYALVNQRVGKFFLGDEPVSKLGFLYCNLKQDYIYNEIVSRGDGSAQPNISPKGIETIRIVLPPKEIIKEFNVSVQKNFELILQNTYQNFILTKIRDNLLPKLMSGEIRVPVEGVQ